MKVHFLEANHCGIAQRWGQRHLPACSESESQARDVGWESLCIAQWQPWKLEDRGATPSKF